MKSAFKVLKEGISVSRYLFKCLWALYSNYIIDIMIYVIRLMHCYIILIKEN